MNCLVLFHKKISKELSNTVDYNGQNTNDKHDEILRNLPCHTLYAFIPDAGQLACGYCKCLLPSCIINCSSCGYPVKDAKKRNHLHGMSHYSTRVVLDSEIICERGGFTQTKSGARKPNPPRFRLLLDEKGEQIPPVRSRLVTKYEVETVKMFGNNRRAATNKILFLFSMGLRPVSWAEAGEGIVHCVSFDDDQLGNILEEFKYFHQPVYPDCVSPSASDLEFHRRNSTL